MYIKLFNILHAISPCTWKNQMLIKLFNILPHLQLRLTNVEMQTLIYKAKQDTKEKRKMGEECKQRDVNKISQNKGIRWETCKQRLEPKIYQNHINDTMLIPNCPKELRYKETVLPIYIKLFHTTFPRVVAIPKSKQQHRKIPLATTNKRKLQKDNTYT